jgi:hypothetical protein
VSDDASVDDDAPSEGSTTLADDVDEDAEVAEAVEDESEP